MKKTTLQLVLIVLTVSMVFISDANAATINATSCSQDAVQQAINAAVSGDTIAVPAGTCTWTSPNSIKGAVIVPTGRKITIKGQGIGNTIISCATKIRLIDIRDSGSRVTGFTFINGRGVQAAGRGWRVDHNRFEYDCSDSKTIISAIGTMTINKSINIAGLIDHNELHNATIVTAQGPVQLAHDRWARPLDLGTEDATYIEDNIFTYDTCTVIQAADTNYGGAYVFRYNKIQDASVMAHAVQANNRATRKWEVYNNIWTKTSRYGIVPGFMRAGTGVWFNNELVGAWYHKNVWLDNQRSCISKKTSGKCDGSSLWDGNTEGESGYPCRDQIGRSTDQWLWTNANPYPPQESEPVYAWNNWMYPTNTDRQNKTNGVPVGLTVKSDICAAAKAHLVEGRDFVNNGTTPKPGYTPYTYPHPLSKPAPVMNLKISQ